MRVTLSSPRLLLALLALVLPAALAACGGSNSGGNSASTPAQPQPTATAEDFPAAKGHTVPDIVNNMPSGPNLAPSVSVLDKGTNRMGFALFDNAGKQLSG